MQCVEDDNFRVDIFDVLGPIPPSNEASAMSFHFRNLRTREWWKLFGPFLTIFVLGLLIRHFYPPSWWSSTTFYALADALMVAGIIGSLIETFSAKFLIERVSDDLSQKLVGRGLPKELQAHIQEITKTKLVRLDYEKRYHLSLLADKMQLEIETTFKVQNYNDLPEPYSPLNIEETFYSPEFTYVEYGVEGEMPKVYKGSALQKQVKETQGGSVRGFTELDKVSIPPYEDDHKFVYVRTCHRVTMPQEYTEITYFGGATIGVRLILDAAPNEFEFSTGSDESLIHVEGSNSWDFKRPFVEGQHVRVRWFRKSQERLPLTYPQT